MELSLTENDHDAVKDSPILVDVDGTTLELHHAAADPGSLEYVLSLAQALAIAKAWTAGAATDERRTFGHSPAIRGIIAAVATPSTLGIDCWASGAFEDEYSTSNCPFGITVRELPPVADVVAVDAVGLFAVPVDPMEDLQCDSCQ